MTRQATQSEAVCTQRSLYLLLLPAAAPRAAGAIGQSGADGITIDHFLVESDVVGRRRHQHHHVLCFFVVHLFITVIRMVVS